MADNSETPAGANDAVKPPRLRKDGTPRKKPGPPKGVRIGGRAKGTQNVKYRLKLKAAELALEMSRKAEEAMRIELEQQIRKATNTDPITGKQAMIQLVNLYMALTAFYQPVAPLAVVGGKIVSPGNPNYDEEKFLIYSELAAKTASSLTPFQDPRYSAVVVGASVVTRVQVEGGMPDDFAPPVPAGEIVELKPGMIISAEEPAAALTPPEPAKAVNQ